MKSFMPWLIGGLLFYVAVARAEQPKPNAPAGKGIEGLWQGALKIAGQELRLIVRLGKKDGALSGTLDSIDQGSKNLALDDVQFKDHQLRLELKAAKAVFEGKLSPDGSEIVGEWKQSGLTLPLTFKRTDKAPELVRPQEPKKPYPYLEEEVAYENAKAGVKLAGTLTLPKEKGPFPAVLLITGSGPQDRDETIFGHKPFHVLADHLTRRGIAVLRVDDRGVGGSTGSLAKATTEDLAEDVLAGVEYLKGRKEINPRQIGLMGHSEGGLIAPLVAARSKDVAFIVLLAGPGLVGEQLLYLQGAAVLKAEGSDEKQIARSRALQEKLFAVVKEEKDEKALQKKLDDLIAEEFAKLDEKDRKEAEQNKSVLGGQVKLLLSPWMRFFLTYDPAPTLGKVRCPVLALVGEKDVQVAAKENLAAIEKALKAGGNKDHTVKELPGLNHLFQTCKTGAVSEYGKIEETMAPSALDLIAEWVLTRTK
jgi:pimeloyl-ACP methyl ester carboxylesterase